MTLPSPDLIHLKRAGNTTVRLRGDTLQILPLTLTVILGPLIAIAYHLTQPTPAQIGSFSIGQPIRGFLCALMLLPLFFSRGLHLLTHRFIRPLLFLTVCAALTTVGTSYPREHVVFAAKIVFLVVLFVSALHFAKEGLIGERWLATCAWVVLLTMATCIGIGLITGRTFNAYKTRYATAGFMSHVSVAAVLILSTLPVFIRRLAIGRAALAGLVILYTSLFFTMRRSALIAAAAATCCSFLIDLNPLRGRIPWRKTLVAVGVLLLLTGIGLNTPAGTDLMARFRDLNPHEGTGSGRYVFWKISLEHILDRPIHAQLWGEGMGCIRNLLQDRYEMAIGSHNDGLDLVNAFGLCGLIGIGWWYLELARFARHLHDQQEGLFQGVCASAIILGLISIGTGGSFEAHWALTYAAMGFWAGRAIYLRSCCTSDDA